MIEQYHQRIGHTLKLMPASQRELAKAEINQAVCDLIIGVIGKESPNQVEQAELKRLREAIKPLGRK